jgi:hypothetical protein
MMNERKNEMTLDQACTILDKEARNQQMGLLEYLEHFENNRDSGDYRPELYRAYRIFIVAGREMFTKV